MILDVDFLIDFFKKHTGVTGKGEMGEQEDAAASSAPTSGGSGKSVPMWIDTYTLKRGKSNPLMKSGEEWETGLTRGAANQVW